MKININEKLKKHLILLGILTLISLIIFSPYIFKVRPFLFSADMQLQYNYFYEQWKKMILEFISKRTLPFYDFNNYLGNNFFSSKFYYLTGDIFMPIVMLFKDVEVGLMWVSILLVIMSGYNFSVFLRSFGLKRENAIIVGSIVYAFSGIASLYVGQYMFHRFYAILPLLFACIEYYIRKNKLAPFAIISAILALTNYYFLFPTCVFMVFYYFFTWYYHKKEFSFFQALKSSLGLIIAFITGICIAGILLIPGFIYILQNERIGNASFSLLYDIKVYIGFIFNYISSPMTLFSKYNYMFYADRTGHLGWYSIYTGALSAPIIFSLFNKKDKTNKEKAIFFMYVSILVGALLPFTSSIFHGFSGGSMRWMFLLTFLNALVLSIYLTHLERRAATILNGAFNYVIVFGVAFIVGIVLKIISIKEYPEHFITILISALIFIVYVYLIKKGKFKYIYILTGIEVCLMMSLHLSVLNSTYYTYNPSLDKNAITYFKDIDSDKFYRMYVSPNDLMPTSDLNLNQSIKMNFNTTTTYDTTIEPSQKVFNSLNGYDGHIVNINNIDVLRMLGVKYYLVDAEEKLPQGYSWSYYNNINHFKMFKLEEYRPIGFTYSNFKTNLDIEYGEENKVIKHDLNWNDELLVDESLFNLISDIEPSDSINFELIEFYNDNNLYGHIVNDTKQVLFFSIPYNEGWRLTDNDMPLTKYKVQGGFIGVILEPGDHYISLRFAPVGLKQGAITSLAGFVLLLGLLIHDFKKKK